MDLYRGYVKTKGKTAITKDWGSGSLLKYDQVKDLDEYAGVLAKNVILLDIDDGTQANIVAKIIKDKKIKCKIVQTTRGKHFYFYGSSVKKCTNHHYIACGLEADFKCGWANSYAVIKYKGIERAVEYDTGEYEDIPAFLRPIKRPEKDLYKMKDGDGRNSALFEYIIPLLNHGFSKQETRETIQIINEYILDEPLDTDELSSVLRDQAFKVESFFNRSKFLHDKFARFLVAEESIKKINGQLHIYIDGVYKANTDLIEGAMIKHIPSLKEAQRKEVLKYLNIMLVNEDKIIDARYIAFKNGVYDLADDKLLSFSPELLVTNKIPHNFNPKAYSKLLDNTLDRIACGDNQVRSVIEECAGYLFWRRQELGKAFLFVGDNRNGKSTILSVFQEMLGRENICSLELQEVGERFNTSMLHNKCACIGDDISDEFMKGRQVSLFKKIVTGNRIKAENKGLPPFEFEPYAKLIFSANQIPRTKDMTGAVMRRLIIIPFRATFTDKDADFDPYIKYKLCESECIEYLIMLGISGLKRVLSANRFTESEAVEKELETYEIENNPALAFIKYTGEKNIIDQRVRDVYIAYKEFCYENGYQALSTISFGKYLRKVLNLESTNSSLGGENAYVYKKIKK